MNEVKNETIFSCEINTNIFDKDLSLKVLEKIKDSKLQVDESRRYNLEVVFDLKSYENKEELFAFVIENKKQWQNDTDEKEKIGLILSQQLNKINYKLEILGFSLSSCKIIGDEINNLDIVKIEIKVDSAKEYDKKGKLKESYRVCNIIPSRPGFIKNLEQAVKYLLESQIRQEINNKIEMQNRIPNMVDVDMLMGNIAKGILLDSKYSRKKRDTEIEEKKKRLLKTYKIDSELPLAVSGNFNNDFESNLDKIDCPEILVYKEYTNGNWSLKKVDYFKQVEDEITKYGYNKKDIKDVVVLKNLEPVSFILISKESNSMNIVKKRNANNYKKLEVCWNEE